MRRGRKLLEPVPILIPRLHATQHHESAKVRSRHALSTDTETLRCHDERTGGPGDACTPLFACSALRRRAGTFSLPALVAHSPLQLSHRPRGVGRTQRVRAALAQGHEGGVAAIPSVRRALPYPAATPTPGWGRTSAKSRAGSPALSKRSRSVACFFLLSPSNFCGRGKEENGRAGTASACAAGAHRGAAGAGNAKQVLQACL